ncbi:thiosulfate oxidation carrier complex protein SoxZ [Telmatospirillum siberiense]|uniref:Thiosulfate oxidation carrier complex protein SoxZ n=1 Tax=Telmatospirillum siberiense TaxID=382514 RepID=A0A2N3PPV3_9PROT|nr:thiosulfate oxidation carrier complex protein SoxZ [Telmatospirillum siberiense]PKU22430.1 thiosulfate oxidation carrier complex protein SoxZ [Telmatospirillum siberiense]
MAKPLIKVPPTAKKGEIIEIKTLIAHPMETGYRAGLNGATLPRDIIRRFVCSLDGEEIFSADFSPAIAANPFLSFFTRIEKSGSITFQWTGDNGFSVSETVEISVS